MMNAITPTPLEALEQAIAMLESILRGSAPCRLDLVAMLQRLKDARDEHYRQQMKDERARAQLRELRSRAKELRHG